MKDFCATSSRRAPAPEPRRRVPPVDGCRRRSGGGSDVPSATISASASALRTAGSSDSSAMASRRRSARPRSRSCRPCRSSSTRSASTARSGHQRQRLLHRRSWRRTPSGGSGRAAARVFCGSGLSVERRAGPPSSRAPGIPRTARRCRDRPARCLAQAHARNSSRRVSRHDGSRPTTGMPRGDERQQRLEQRAAPRACASSTRPVARKVRPQHSARRAHGRPGDGDAIAGRLQHAPRGVQRSPARNCCEGVDEEHDRRRRLRRRRRVVGEEGVAAPLRQRALLRRSPMIAAARTQRAG